MCIFSKENKIILTLNIDHSDIGEKIYFLQNYDKMKNILMIKRRI